MSNSCQATCFLNPDVETPAWAAVAVPQIPDPGRGRLVTLETGDACDNGRVEVVAVKLNGDPVGVDSDLAGLCERPQVASRLSVRGHLVSWVAYRRWSALDTAVRLVRRTANASKDGEVVDLQNRRKNGPSDAIMKVGGAHL